MDTAYNKAVSRRHFVGITLIVVNSTASEDDDEFDEIVPVEDIGRLRSAQDDQREGLKLFDGVRFNHGKIMLVFGKIVKESFP